MKQITSKEPPQSGLGAIKYLKFLLAIILLANVQGLQAVTLPFSDSFSYTDTSRLGGTGGGDTIWTIGNSLGNGSITNFATSALSYSGLPAGTGGGAQLKYPGTSAKERGVDTAAYNMTGAGETLYASFLINVTSYPVSNCPVAYFDDNGSASSSFQGVGILADGRLTLHRNAAITAAGATNTTALSLNTTYLLVFRYKSVSGSGNDELALWINPALGQPAETTPDLISAVGGSDRAALRGFFFKQDSAFTAVMNVDELRLGTQWTEVTPSAICYTAGFSSNPANATNSVGSTVSFSCVATGSVPTVQWQVSTDVGSSWNNVSTGTGGTSGTYTTATLNSGDNGNLYRCIANVSCDSSSATSTVAQVTVIDVSNKHFRSVTSGNWSAAGTWQMSADGITWAAAPAPPSVSSSNIVVRSPDTVTISDNVTADQVSVASGGKLLVAGGNFTLNDFTDTYDLAVTGTLEVGAGSGTNAFGSAGVRFQSGGSFNWNRAAAPVIPAATWNDGSTCRISATSTSADVFASGISGQSYYDLVFDATVGGQSRRCRLNIQGTATTVRHNFSVNVPDTANASVTINNETNGILTVNGNVTFATGASANSTKVLLNNANANNYTLKIGGNFSVSGYLDGFGGSATVVEFTGAGSHTLTLPTGANFITKSAVNFLVDSTSTVVLGSNVDGFNTFTNNGTLTFGANRINGGTSLVLASGSQINADGINQIIFAVTTVELGGTLNLGSLPAFTGGESFTLIGAGTYIGAFGPLLPTVPDGTHTWVITQLNSAGILAVSGGAPPTANITFIQNSPGQIVLNWPTGQGWILQAQTNNSSTGLGNNWVDVPGATPPFTNLVNPANPAVFYRLMQ